MKSGGRRAKAFLLLAAIVLFAVGGALAWNNLIRDQVLPKRFVSVEPGSLYRSGQISSRLIRDVLVEYEIEMVLDLNGNEPRWEEHQEAERNAISSLGIDYMQVPMMGDGTGTLDQFFVVLSEIHKAQQAGRPTLVHCAAGARRTGAVIALYQVLLQQIPAEQAIRELGRYGSGLEGSNLLKFSNEQMRPLSERLYRHGLIDEIPNPMPRFVVP